MLIRTPLYGPVGCSRPSINLSLLMVLIVNTQSPGPRSSGNTGSRSVRDMECWVGGRRPSQGAWYNRKMVDAQFWFYGTSGVPTCPDQYKLRLPTLPLIKRKLETSSHHCSPKLCVQQTNNQSINQSVNHTAFSHFVLKHQHSKIHSQVEKLKESSSDWVVKTAQAMWREGPFLIHQQNTYLVKHMDTASYRYTRGTGVIFQFNYPLFNQRGHIDLIDTLLQVRPSQECSIQYIVNTT